MREDTKGGKIEAREPTDTEIRKNQNFTHAGQSYVNTFHTSDITRIAKWTKNNTTGESYLTPDNGFPDFREKANYTVSTNATTSLSIVELNYKVLPSAGYGWAGGGVPTAFVTTSYLKLSRALADGEEVRVNFHNLSASFTNDIISSFARSNAVQANQHGYHPNDKPKIAFLSLWLPKGEEKATANSAVSYDQYLGKSSYDGTFFVVNLDNSQIVNAAGNSKRAINLRFGGSQTSTGLNFGKVGTYLYEMNFSDVTAPGNYKICVYGIGCSHPFKIANTVWKEAFETSMQGLYHHRSGIELDGRYGYTRPRDHHPDDGITIKLTNIPFLAAQEGSNTSTNQIFNLTQIQCLSSSKGKINADLGTQATSLTTNLSIGRYDNSIMANGALSGVEMNVWGGYHDAGDWDRRIQHMSVSYDLLDLYELNPDYFKSYNLNLPSSRTVLGERYGELPDILDEALFNLDFYRRMQITNGPNKGAVSGGIEHDGSLSDATPSWGDSVRTSFAYAPDPVSTYIYAYGAAKAAIVLQDLNPELSAIYLRTAIDAWDWAIKSETDIANFSRSSNAECKLDNSERYNPAGCVYKMFLELPVNLPNTDCSDPTKSGNFECQIKAICPANTNSYLPKQLDPASIDTMIAAWKEKIASKVNYAKFSAAAALFRATSNANYQGIVQALDSSTRGYDSNSTVKRGAWEYYLATGQDLANRLVNTMADYQNNSPYGSLYHRANITTNWGINSVPNQEGVDGLRGALVALAGSDSTRHSQAKKLFENFVSSASFVWGANGVNQSLTVGLGENQPSDPLHTDFHKMHVSPPKGITVYGFSDFAPFFPWWAFAFHDFNRLEPKNMYGGLPTWQNFFNHNLMIWSNEYTVQQTIAPTAYIWGFMTHYSDNGNTSPFDKSRVRTYELVASTDSSTEATPVATSTISQEVSTPVAEPTVTPNNPLISPISVVNSEVCSPVNYVLYDYPTASTVLELPDFDSTAVIPISSGQSKTFTTSKLVITDVPDVNYALTLSNTLYIDKAGIYQFHLSSDDGSKLFMNGVQVIDNGSQHPLQTKSARVELGVGSYDLVIHYFQASGGKGLQLEWNADGEAPAVYTRDCLVVTPTPTATPTPIPTATPSPTPSPTTVVTPQPTPAAPSESIDYILYSYPNAAKIGKLPDFSSNSVSEIKRGTTLQVSNPGQYINNYPKTNFALAFDATFNTAKDSSHTFELQSDDGSKLYIDDKLVIDNDGQHGMSDGLKTARINLSAGQHKLRLEYFQAKGGKGLILNRAAENGRLIPFAIEEATQTPTQTPSPTATDTPVVTQTATPIATATPTATQTSTPIATATPVATTVEDSLAPVQFIYDSSGNLVTIENAFYIGGENQNDIRSAVKEFLKIPVTFKSNLSRGKVLDDKYCLGCHATRPRRLFSYEYIKNKIATTGSMAGLPLSIESDDSFKPEGYDEALGSIVAYLWQSKMNGISVGTTTSPEPTPTDNSNSTDGTSTPQEPAIKDTGVSLDMSEFQGTFGIKEATILCERLTGACSNDDIARLQRLGLKGSVNEIIRPLEFSTESSRDYQDVLNHRNNVGNTFLIDHNGARINLYNELPNTRDPMFMNPEANAYGTDIYFVNNAILNSWIKGSDAMRYRMKLLAFLQDERLSGNLDPNSNGPFAARRYAFKNSINHMAGVFNYWQLLWNASLSGDYRNYLKGTMTDHILHGTYLDGYSNTKLAPNENFAREFWEIGSTGTRFHSGKPGNGGMPIYSEVDVSQANKCLTGLVPILPGSSPKRLFNINSYEHALFPGFDPNLIIKDQSFTVFGGTEWEAKISHSTGKTDCWEKLFTATMAHPATAENLAQELIQEFLHPNPNYTSVKTVADVLIKTNFNMHAAIRAIVQSKAMYDGTTQDRLLVRPYEHYVSAFRKIPSLHKSIGRGIDENDGKLYGGDQIVTRSVGEPGGLEDIVFVNPNIFGVDVSIILSAGGQGVNRQFWENQILANDNFAWRTSGLYPVIDPNNLQSCREAVKFYADLLRVDVTPAQIEGLATALNGSNPLSTQRITDTMVIVMLLRDPSIFVK